jgi:hypothetical protein
VPAVASPPPTAVDPEDSDKNPQLVAWQLVWNSSRQRDSARLAQWAEDTSTSPNTRVYATYLLTRLQPKPNWQAFLEAFPRDGSSLIYLVLYPGGVLDIDCGTPERTCSPDSMLEQLVSLAEKKNRYAVRTFAESLLSHTDGAATEWVSLDVVPRLMKAVPKLLIEESAKQSRSADRLVDAILYSRAAPPRDRAQIAAIRALHVSGTEARALQAKLVHELTFPPDWP